MREVCKGRILEAAALRQSKVPDDKSQRRGSKIASTLFICKRHSRDNYGIPHRTRRDVENCELDSSFI